MKRNSIFNTIPLLRPKRNTFNLSFENKLSTDLFRLTPIFCKEALPDDVFKIRPEIFCRVSPMISPIFHRLNIRTYYFFVPTRIIWDDFEKWINPKTGTTDIVPPKLTVENLSASGAIYGNFAPKTLADYLGVNFGLNAEDQSNLITFTTKMATIFPLGFTISSLPFRAYQQIYNDWFIDLNNVDTADFSKASGVEVLGNDDTADAALESALLKLRYRAWEHDYFTSALPEPQRGPDVNAFDGGSSEGGSISGLEITGSGLVDANISSITTQLDVNPLQFEMTTDGGVTFTNVSAETIAANFYSSLGFPDATTAVAAVQEGFLSFALGNGGMVYGATGQPSSMKCVATQHLPNGEFVSVVLPYNSDSVLTNTPNSWVRPKELKTSSKSSQFESLGSAQISGSDIANALSVTASGEIGPSSIPAVTVEELRIRMQMQSFLERNEVGGSRYTEMLYAHWGVKDPDGRLQRSEFIGGCKQPIVISDISQTVNTDDEPLGAYGGQGTSSSAGKTIKFRVPEHGYIIGITTIVPRSGYSQGIHPMWTRFDRLDYYWPSFAHLGEQEVKYRELMFTGINPEDTFGYQQRYAEYKSSTDEVHGDMKGSLAHWHMSRIFDTPSSSDDMPKLSEFFTTPQDSDSDALSRVWPVESTGFEVLNADHFVLDIYQHVFASRRMPKYATPRNGS